MAVWSKIKGLPVPVRNTTLGLRFFLKKKDLRELMNNKITMLHGR
jgi:hypothetical protein